MAAKNWLVQSMPIVFVSEITGLFTRSLRIRGFWRFNE